MRGAPIPASVRAEVRERSGGYCEIGLPGCWRRAIEMHHKKSRARGGTNTALNIVDACTPCHHKITIHYPGTGKWRTHSWQKEGEGELDVEKC